MRSRSMASRSLRPSSTLHSKPCRPASRSCRTPVRRWSTTRRIGPSIIARRTASICRPKELSKSAGYYGTALHELAHWSGHFSRLNRPTLTESYRFGDTNYAREELRAELASVFLAAERGIPHDPEQHAAYVENWIQALQQDKHEIFRAAHDASAITDYLLAFERERLVEAERSPIPLARAATIIPAEVPNHEHGRSGPPSQRDAVAESLTAAKS